MPTTSTTCSATDPPRLWGRLSERRPVVSPVLGALVAGVETSRVAEAIASVLAKLASPVRRLPNGRSPLNGTFLGHPVHPLLVTAPLGAWASACVLDLGGRDPRAARSLVGAGSLLALPSALAGANDWLDTDGAERRVGGAHAALNLCAMGVYAASWLLRAKHHRAGVVAGLAGVGLLATAGWLGGHLTYAMGVGVDTNAFSTGPQEWTDLGIEAQASAARLAQIDGARLAVTEVDGRAAVLGDRCSHRGGPLSEGKVVQDCFTCPWHGSRFDAVTGAVRRGPASVPQPVYETRRVDGSTQVRRKESRSLRTNPV